MQCHNVYGKSKSFGLENYSNQDTGGKYCHTNQKLWDIDFYMNKGFHIVAIMEKLSLKPFVWKRIFFK